MSTYIESLKSEVKEYYKILSSDFPKWLEDYIEVPEMLRLDGISMASGTDYPKMYNYKSFNSVLQHSIGVALIVWNFTHDRKQTLAGLYHDIASPSFKHCIDFLNGDSEKQESIEEGTEEIIKNSSKIMSLLKRDGIEIKEISDYHIYPIADNDTPRLSADRFEYTFSNAFFLYDVWDLARIKYFYDNIIILKNEDGLDELSFGNVDVCKEYLEETLPIFSYYHSDENTVTMQYISDIIKSMHVKGYLSINDLYKLSEKEVLDKILTCDDNYIKEALINWQNATYILKSETYISDKYCTNVKGKTRYIVPLVSYNGGAYRITEVLEECREKVTEYLNAEHSTYKGFDFSFKPYKYE